VRPQGLSHDAKHRYYWNGDGPLTSVTTALSVIAKPALIAWAKGETAACAVRNVEIVQRMISESGPDRAVAWLRQTPDYKRDVAADLGTRVHLLAEKIIAGEPVELSEDEQPYVRQFMSFLDDVQPEFIHSERQIANLTVGYAGTLDAIVRVDGYTALWDFKTSKGCYPEYGLQLAAYGHAEFLADEGDATPTPMPAIDKYAVVHLRPDGWSLVTYHVGEAEWAAFRAALELYRWTQGPAKEVMG